MDGSLNALKIHWLKASYRRPKGVAMDERRGAWHTLSRKNTTYIHYIYHTQYCRICQVTMVHIDPTITSHAGQYIYSVISISIYILYPMYGAKCDAWCTTPSMNVMNVSAREVRGLITELPTCSTVHRLHTVQWLDNIQHQSNITYFQTQEAIPLIKSDKIIQK